MSWYDSFPRNIDSYTINLTEKDKQKTINNQPAKKPQRKKRETKKKNDNNNNNNNNNNKNARNRNTVKPQFKPKKKPTQPQGKQTKEKGNKKVTFKKQKTLTKDNII